MRTWKTRGVHGGRWLVTAAVGMCGAAGAAGDIIYETADPFGGPFGLWGYDVFVNQSVAVRFTPDRDYLLDRISLWFMNNSTTEHPQVRITLRDDDNDGSRSIPGSTIHEEFFFNVSAVGWDPQLEVLNSSQRPWLQAGVNYWVVAESDAPPAEDGVWNIASFGTGFMANTDQSIGGDWFPGHEGAVVCTIVEGTCVVFGDLTGDGRVGFDDLVVLLGDYGCVGDCAGDMDGDGDTDFDDLVGLLTNYGDECL